MPRRATEPFEGIKMPPASPAAGRAEGAARTPSSQLLSSLFEIKTWMGWQSTVSDRYISDPIPATVGNDFIFSTGFYFTLSH